MKDYFDRQRQLAEDLVNTYDTYLSQPEHLQTPQDLENFLVKHGIGVDALPGEKALAEVYTLRNQLRAVYAATQEAEAAQLLNELMREVSLRPELACEAEQRWYMRLRAEPEASTVQRLRAEAVVGLSHALEHYGKARLRVCASEPCRDVFLDTSRNGTRRFCSDRCANRYNVASFRARQTTRH